MKMQMQIVIPTRIFVNEKDKHRLMLTLLLYFCCKWNIILTSKFNIFRQSQDQSLYKQFNPISFFLPKISSKPR